MSLRGRLIVLFAVLTLLPALPAAWVMQGVLGRTVDIALRDDIDAALDAGVRQTREALALQRMRLQDVAAVWQEALAAGTDPASITAPADVRVDADGVRVAAGDPRLDTLPARPERGAPPFVLHHRVRAGAVSLTFSAPVDSVWRADALRTSESLQMMRLLRDQRTSIERAFLIPFLAIVGGALVIALLTAWWLSRGITHRMDRLVAATDAVARGDWSTRVDLEGDDELARLGEGFDSMVASLDAQSRRLVDLETMAGWREMARALAHEVKNPLTPIQLTVEEIRERYDGDDRAYRELLDECTRIVIEEVQSLREVVGRFREFARPVELKHAPLDAAALLRDVGALQRDLEVVDAIDDDLPRVTGDADRLRQILMNLASNAREAGAKRLKLSTAVRDGAVALIFEDDGPGIPVEDRPHVFEPYRTGKAGGLGLGLALVKGIVLAHGGAIDVDEGEWHGARFTVTLPTPSEERA